MPVFWILVILGAVLLWGLLFFIFPVIGRVLCKWFNAIKRTLLDKNKNTKE